MKIGIIGLLFVLGIGSTPTWADDPSLSAVVASNPELRRLLDEDQADRSGMVKGSTDLNAMNRHDALHHAAVRKLLSQGQLQSGEDFTGAALIFQHSLNPDDLLLAHVLAMVALEKGYKPARWIAASTLDRYLQTIGQGQVFGTQFRSTTGHPITQDPFDRTLLSDVLRREMGVPPLAEQWQRFETNPGRAVLSEKSSGPQTVTPLPTNNITCNQRMGERVFLRAKWTIHMCSDGSYILTSGNAVVVASVAGQQVYVTVGRPGDKEETDAAVAALKPLSRDQLAAFFADTKAGKD